VSSRWIARRSGIHLLSSRFLPRSENLWDLPDIGDHTKLARTIVPIILKFASPGPALPTCSARERPTSRITRASLSNVRSALYESPATAPAERGRSAVGGERCMHELDELRIAGAVRARTIRRAQTPLVRSLRGKVLGVRGDRASATRRRRTTTANMNRITVAIPAAAPGKALRSRRHDLLTVKCQRQHHQKPHSADTPESGQALDGRGRRVSVVSRGLPETCRDIPPTQGRSARQRARPSILSGPCTLPRFGRDPVDGRERRDFLS
jgi:hypothetical protein